MGLAFPSGLDSRLTGARPVEVAGAIWRRRLILALLVATAGAAGLALSHLLAPPPRAEPELVRLLRAMVLIKGLFALGAAALLWWRLGRPIGPALAARYGTAVGLCAAALGWLWGLHLLLLGSLAFYGGLAGLLLAARRDPLLLAWRPAGRADRGA